jgi:hypothetical protein
VVLALLRRAGPRIGGIAAAVPVTSTPALAWACQEHGAEFAAASATAALLATGMTGWFALRYARIAHRRPPWQALMMAATPPLVLTSVVGGIGTELLECWLATTALLTLCCRWMPRDTGAARPAARSRRDMGVTIAAAGGLTVLVGALGPRVPPLLCGLLAAIPIVGMTTSVSVHAQRGPDAVVAFLQGYLRGLFAKAAFLTCLAVFLPAHAGAMPWLVAAALGVAVGMALPRCRALGPLDLPLPAQRAEPIPALPPIRRSPR